MVAVTVVNVSLGMIILSFVNFMYSTLLLMVDTGMFPLCRSYCPVQSSDV